MSKKNKKRVRYGYESFSLQQSFIEKRDEMARQDRVEEQQEEDRLVGCRCPFCGYFSNSPEAMTSHYQIKHIFYAKSKEAES